MRALLVYPVFPPSFWSFEGSLRLFGKKVLLPPLGLITVAAILPQDWEFKLVDCNIRPVSEEEWQWADLVVMSSMNIQQADLLKQIKIAQSKGKPVAVGGPFATSSPEILEAAGVDYLVLDEGELTLPDFVQAIERGETKGIFRATEKPDVTQTPIPRFDLLELDAYNTLSVQFSRGCPFQCEFCDIIVLYGRKPRTKHPQQILAELETIYNLGHRGPIFMVDDNFIGNKRNVKLLLKELVNWQQEREYPFRFTTEASIDLAEDQELIDLMVACNFERVFIGLETPDEDSLSLTKKFQNTRHPLIESLRKIEEAGIEIMAGLIIGFDGERSGAGIRILDFVEEAHIPIASLNMLQALPGTALWHRLESEGRLLEGMGDINQTTLTNFIPTRPMKEIAEEYLQALERLYDPVNYLTRTYNHFLKLSFPRSQRKISKQKKPVTSKVLSALATIVWRQGIKRSSRWKFWQYLFVIYQKNPKLLLPYLATCAQNEHFLEYREVVKKQIQKQLNNYGTIDSLLNKAQTVA